jgi:DNA-binding beta-propeller fold protein YncE
MTERSSPSLPKTPSSSLMRTSSARPIGHPVVGLLPEGGRGPVYVQFSKDDAILFVSEERNASIVVIDVAALRQGITKKAVIGRIPVGEEPVGLALSPDGTRLFATSQVVGSAGACRPEKEGGPTHAKGALLAIDVAKTVTDGRHAVSGVMRAGCNPVRVVVLADDRSLWVSNRGDDHVMGVDPSILTPGAARGRTTLILVGPSPVGLPIRPDGSELWVANSDRFGLAGDSLTLVRLTSPAAPQVACTLKVDAFPRDLRFFTDGRAIVVALFGDDSVMLHPTTAGADTDAGHAVKKVPAA